MYTKKSFKTLIPGGIFLVENFDQERADVDNMNAESFNRQAEMRKQQAEVASAILLLKTNLSLFLALVFVFLIAIFLSSDVLALIFSFLKNLAPVVTCFVNFEKNQISMVNIANIK
jgi:hypothetical protein